MNILTGCKDPQSDVIIGFFSGPLEPRCNKSTQTDPLVLSRFNPCHLLPLPPMKVPDKLCDKQPLNNTKLAKFPVKLFPIGTLVDSPLNRNTVKGFGKVLKNPPTKK